MSAQSIHHSSDYLHTRYLKSTGLGTAFDSSAESPERFGVAIFGLGRAGSIHLNNILATPRLRLRYLVDNSTARLAQVQENYCLGETCKFLTDDRAKEVFADKTVSAVVISTPSTDHESLVCAALEAGKHVLCEKPVALSLPAVEKCYDMAIKAGKSLLCAFNRRYDPAYSSIADSVSAGALGQIQCISTVSRDCSRPTMEYLKISGGIFIDCIVHDVDLICHVLKEYPDKVFAAAHCFSEDIRALGDYDTVVATMHFPSGVLAHIDVSRHAVYGYDQRLEVYGSKGMLRSGNQRPVNLESSLVDNDSQVPILHSFPSRYSEAYSRQMDHFLDLVDGKAEQVITKADVVKVSKVLYAMEESARKEAYITVKFD